MEKLNDKKVEIFTGQVLRTGMLVSWVITFLGMSLYLWRYSSASPNYRTFHPNHGKFAIGTLFPNAFYGDPIALIQLGILLLIATPVARVAFLVGAFALEHDRLYVAVSGLVLAILLYSLVFFR